jgi:hypothetical protein
MKKREFFFLIQSLYFKFVHMISSFVSLTLGNFSMKYTMNIWEKSRKIKPREMNIKEYQEIYLKW